MRLNNQSTNTNTNARMKTYTLALTLMLIIATNGFTQVMTAYAIENARRVGQQVAPQQRPLTASQVQNAQQIARQSVPQVDLQRPPTTAYETENVRRVLRKVVPEQSTTPVQKLPAQIIVTDPAAAARYQFGASIVEWQESIADCKKDIAEIKAKAAKRQRWHDKSRPLIIGENSSSADDIAAENEARRQGIPPGELTYSEKASIAFHEQMIARAEDIIAILEGGE
jgi:hypothetical protein